MRSGHTAPQITTHVLKLNVRVRALERARARPSRPRAAARGTPGPCPCGPGAPARARRENKTRIYFWENFSISRESFSRFTGNSTTLCQNLRNSRSESKTTMGMARHRPPCLSSLASAQTPHYEDPACSKSDPGIDETATPRSVDLSHARPRALNQWVRCPTRQRGRLGCAHLHSPSLIFTTPRVDRGAQSSG